MLDQQIPADWRERTPCIDAASWRGLKRILQHPSAPRWNRQIGDRVGPAEREALERFRETLRDATLESGPTPSPAMLHWVDSLRDRVLLLKALPHGFDMARDFERLPSSSREDITRRLEQLVPLDADLDSAIVYSTSGTTGHPVIVPSHPGAMVKNLAHLEVLAQLHGVPFEPAAGQPFMLNVSAQQRTYVFATSMSGLSGAIFAKLNLSLHDWAGGARSRHEFIADFAAPWVASEPVTMAEMLRLELPFAPQLIVSSAVTLRPELAKQVHAQLGAQVVDLYSTTETGPIAASLPSHPGMHIVLLPDVFIEILAADDRRLPDGEVGEIAVTGGRNPNLPLLRYRTGDYGSAQTVALSDGRSARAIVGLEGRAPMRFEAFDGRRISSVDIARSIRPVGPYVQHQLLQRADRSVLLRLKPLPGVPIPLEGMQHVLQKLFGEAAQVLVVLDEQLGGAVGKVVPWVSELQRKG